MGGPGRAPPLTSERAAAAGPQLLRHLRIEVRGRLGPGLRADAARGQRRPAGRVEAWELQKVNFTYTILKSLSIKISQSRPVAMSACLDQYFPSGHCQAPCTGGPAPNVHTHQAQQLGANINRKEKYLAFCTGGASIWIPRVVYFDSLLFWLEKSKAESSFTLAKPKFHMCK